MKKYIPVFGPQELFDGADDGIEFAVEYWSSTSADDGNKSIHFIASIARALAFVQSVSVTAIAHRRIEEVPEPKRWTAEDRNAGLLPEVGCRAIWHDDNGMKYTVKIETAFFGNECAVSIDDEAIYFAEKFCLFPIETPAEKAQRLKSEWCAKAAKQLKNLEHTSTLKSIYDALLSGELKAPESTE